MLEFLFSSMFLYAGVILIWLDIIFGQENVFVIKRFGEAIIYILLYRDASRWAAAFVKHWHKHTWESRSTSAILFLSMGYDATPYDS